MRIALVDAHFFPELGYQPTGWFNAFTAMGHETCVFTSCHVWWTLRNFYGESFEPGRYEHNGGWILRLPARKLPRNMVRCRGLLEEILRFRPELTLALYPGTMFPLEIIANRDRLPGTLICCFGENRAQRRGPRNDLKHKLARCMLDASFFLFKRRYYQKTMKAADFIVWQTPDTGTYLPPRVARGGLLRTIRAKSAVGFLGFDSAVFRADEDARRAERRRLRIEEDETVIVQACKITDIKRLDLWVAVVAALMRRTPRLRAMLIGFRDHDPESDRALRYVRGSGLADRFLCLPFADRERLPRLYNAADVGFWHLQPSVTIQEAMGTGLYVVLPDAATVSHLLVDSQCGRYFREEDFDHGRTVLSEAMDALRSENSGDRASERRRRAEANARAFSYGALAKTVVQAAQDPSNGARHLDFRCAADRCKTLREIR